MTTGRFIDAARRSAWQTALIATLCAVAMSCADVSIGTTSSPNEKAPDGTIVAQASFTSLNGKTVTGVATIYRNLTTNADTIRLQGISVPESGLQIVGYSNDDVIYRSSLRSTAGTMNYSTGLASLPRWTAVNIYSPTAALDYGTAAFPTSSNRTAF